MKLQFQKLLQGDICFKFPVSKNVGVERVECKHFSNSKLGLIFNLSKSSLLQFSRWTIQYHHVLTSTVYQTTEELRAKWKILLINSGIRLNI